MGDEDSGDSRLTRLRQVGLGLALAEQRQEGGEASPGSRFGPPGRMLKWLVRRLIRFHTQRQGEFNLGVVRALREAEGALRELTERLADSQREVVELRRELARRWGALDSSLATYAQRGERLGRRVTGLRKTLDGLRRSRSEREELVDRRFAELERRASERADRLASTLIELERRMEDLSAEWPHRTEVLESDLQTQGEQVIQAIRDLERLERETLTLGARFPRLEEDLRGHVKGSLEQLEGDWARRSEQMEATVGAHESRLAQLHERLVATIAGMQALKHQTADLGAQLPTLAQELRDALERLERSQGEAQRRTAQLEESLRGEAVRVGDLFGAIEAVTTDLERLATASGDLELRLPELARDVRRRLGRMEELLRPALPLDYLGFERRFRGDEELIKERMRAYAQRFGAVERVLDAGCGRGEFLELCRELGTGGYGVDADASMVSRCRTKGLAVVQGDVLTHLAGLEDRSLDGIFSAQVVEHFSAAELLRFLRLAAAKLRRGGLIILETINPDTYSALRTFYVDVTHRQPIPSRTLAFLLEDAGFSVRETVFSSHPPEEQKLAPLQPRPSKGRPPALAAELVRSYNENCARLNEILFGPQDYAVIAEL